MSFFRIVAVGIGGRDIEVAEQDQFFVARYFVADRLACRGKRRLGFQFQGWVLS